MHFATKQWVGYDPAATHEAAGWYSTHRERQVLAATSQSRAQVARRKPVTQGRPAEQIPSRSPTTASGRELTLAHSLPVRRTPCGC
jgi:hypothetical protein